MWRRSDAWWCGLALLAAMLLASCASATSTASQPTLAPSTTSLADNANRYIDPKLGFSLVLPDGWHAEPQPGRAASSTTEAVTLIGDEAGTHQMVVLGVMQGAGMAAAFAARGAPEMRIGSYPAFADDRSGREARVPCLVRIFLAGDDYVLADWCAMDAATHTSTFEMLLATYLPAPATFAPRSTGAPVSQSCAAMQQQLGYAAGVRWGAQLGAANAVSPAAGWGTLAPGVAVCDNVNSADQYLFQCTELANRFVYERWALPHIPGNAARYFDYYQDGVEHSGVVRDLPAGAVALSDDASQGISAFAPQPGDLLIFQDVNNPRSGWTSGLTTSPGHVAVITAVDASQVFVAQENYSERAYFQALPLTHTTRGWAITDRSGISNRIVRGWIHFAASDGG